MRSETRKAGGRWLERNAINGRKRNKRARTKVKYEGENAKERAQNGRFYLVRAGLNAAYCTS